MKRQDLWIVETWQDAASHYPSCPSQHSQYLPSVYTVSYTSDTHTHTHSIACSTAHRMVASYTTLWHTHTHAANRWLQVVVFIPFSLQPIRSLSPVSVVHGCHRSASPPGGALSMSEPRAEAGRARRTQWKGPGPWPRDITAPWLPRQQRPHCR